MTIESDSEQLETPVLSTKVIPLRAIATSAGECSRCAASLEQRLKASPSIELAHLNGSGDALILHYDPEFTSLSTIEDIVREEGLRLDARYKHVLFNIEGLHCADCAATLENTLRSLQGVLSAEVSYAAATLKLEYDAAVVDEATIVAQSRRLGYELVPVGPAMIKLSVGGMDCADCAVNLEKQLRQLEGVGIATVDFASGTLTIEPNNDSQDLLPQVKRTVSQAGYSVLEDEQQSRAENLLLETATEEWPAVVAGALIASGAILNLLGLEFPAGAAFLIAILVGGFRVARSGIRTLLLTRTLNIDVLMTIAVAGAVLIGELSEAAMVVFLFAVGEALEGYTMDRARQAIRRLMDLTPRQAIRLHDGHEDKLPVASLAPGDLILVGPGESIPVDGFIREGQSAINEAAITGESVPVSKKEGDEVYAGAINGMQAIKVEVTVSANDSTVARIIRMVEEAQSRRAPAQRLVERFSRYYTPAVVIIALLIALLPPLLNLGPFREWLYRSLVLLVISCPCALVISTPVAVVSAIARAARRGVIFKGGAYLEEMGKVQAIALDKTGTLTTGRPVVKTIMPLADITEEELLSLAATIEARSSHPLAAAVTREAAIRELKTAIAIERMEEVAGQGVFASTGNERFCAGRAEFVMEQCRAGDENDENTQALRDLEDQGQTVIAVARNGELLGYIGLQDSVRPEAIGAVEQLHQLGLRVAMLTGDNQRTAAAIARETKVDEFKASLRPEDKQDAVRELGKEFGSVAMVGDGVNDAPALAASAVGIAMGAAGSHAALETADVVLMADDLNKLPGVVRLSKRARSTIITNVALALAIKGLFLALAVAGVATLWMAVFADVGASLIVIFNGMRLLKAEV